MASSHKSTEQSKRQKHVKDVATFSKSYSAVSLIVTLILVVLAYKDVLYLRFGTDVIPESSSAYSDGTKQLLFDGFSSNLSRNFFGILPFVTLIILLGTVIYFAISAYKRTYENLNISKHYVNAKRVPPSKTALKYIAVCSAAFTVPLLYWCLYLTVWFPKLVTYPIKFITSANLLPLVVSSFATILLLSVLTHLGVVISRLAIRLFRYI